MLHRVNVQSLCNAFDPAVSLMAPLYGFDSEFIAVLLGFLPP
jgi:hypothetical protein